MSRLLYTLAIGREWQLRATAMIQSARDAGYEGEVFVQTKPVKKSLWHKYPPHFTKYVVDLPAADEILFVDADCLFNRSPDILFECKPNRFAADIVHIGDGQPVSVKYGTALMSDESVERHKGKLLANAGLWLVDRTTWGRLSQAVLLEHKIHPENESDQACINKYLWELNETSWTYFPADLVAYGAIGAKENPSSVVTHYIDGSGKHMALDSAIRRRFPDIGMQLSPVITESSEVSLMA